MRDVEALCRAALKRSGRKLSHHEYEDELARLIAECWRLSERYDRSKDRALEKGRLPTFSDWAFYHLVRAASAGQRERYRTRWVTKDGVYERPAPQFAKLGECELEHIERKGTVDPARDRAPDLARLLTGGDRRRARDLDILGERPPRRVA